MKGSCSSGSSSGSSSWTATVNNAGAALAAAAAAGGGGGGEDAAWNEAHCAGSGHGPKEDNSGSGSDGHGSSSSRRSSGTGGSATSVGSAKDWTWVEKPVMVAAVGKPGFAEVPAVIGASSSTGDVVTAASPLAVSYDAKYNGAQRAERYVVVGGEERAVVEGPRGGLYYINKNGNKSPVADREILVREKQ